MIVAALLDSYMRLPPAGMVLERDAVSRNLIRAVRFYAGYASLQTPVDLSEGNRAEVDGIEVTYGEWVIIEPLFRLYCEHENSMNLEASRSLGVDVYGRATSEIAQDISRVEEGFPLLCFNDAPFTV